MIVLNSTDNLSVHVPAGGTVSVHASWIDWSGGTPTPGRENTLITGNATPQVVPGPTSGQRCVKYLSLYNSGTSAVALYLSHTDGTNNVYLLGNTSTLFTLAAGSQAVYAEGEGWRITDSAGSTTTSRQPGCLLKVSVLESQTTEFFTFYPAATTARIRGVGGGGGGGGTSSHASDAGAAGGGGAGGHCEYFLNNLSSFNGATTYNCGAAGAGASAAAGGAGQPSIFTLFGGVVSLQAGGGAGGAEGTAAATVTVHAGGAGGTSTGGSVNAAGAPGRRGLCPFVGSGTTEIVIGGSGGAGPFGAGGQGGIATFGGTPTGYGGGGGGASAGASSALSGGNGAPGLWIVEEYS